MKKKDQQKDIMKIDEKLRQEVILLHNYLFKQKIEPDAKDVSSSVMFRIVFLFADTGGSPFMAASNAEEAVSKITDENKRLLICKQLLTGEVAKIPGMRGDFMLYSVFYDMHTGEEINAKLKKEMKEELNKHVFIPTAKHRVGHKIK